MENILQFIASLGFIFAVLFVATFGISRGMVLILPSNKWQKLRLAVDLMIFSFLCPFLYSLIYYFISAISGPGENNEVQYSNCIDGATSYWDIVYFSFTTFTTLGYGDLKPLALCRAASSIEAVLGYVFLGLVISAASRLPLEKLSVGRLFEKKLPPE